MGLAKRAAQYLGVFPKNPPGMQLATRNPTSSDKSYKKGWLWLNTSALTAWMWPGSGNWIALGSGTTGGIVTITGDSGGAESPSAGNFNLKGTANQIAVTGSANTETFSLIGPYTPATYTAHGVLIGAGTSSIVATAVGTTGQVFTGATGANPGWSNSISVSGSITAGTTLTATLGAITATNGNLVLGTVGNKLVIAAGANGGVNVTAAMSGTPGAVTVTNSAVTSSSIILYSRATTGGTPGNVSITAQSNGSFTLTSTGNETSTFNYLVIN